MRKITFEIPQEFDKSTVENYLIKEKHFSNRLLRKLKRVENGILCNKKHARSIDTIYKGDLLEVFLQDSKYLQENSTANVPIVYEDEDVIVYNKPVGMPVHPSHLHQGDTLGNAFASHCSGISFRPINRLDKDTSGLCVVAKNAYSAKILQSGLEKVYYAIASGKILDSGRIDLPISRTSDSIISREVSENGQRAVTNFEIISRTDKYFLAKIYLETGRTHQIRVHFSHIGCPLAGDDMYGGDCSDIAEQALHCGEVKFLQPISGKEIQLKAPIRADMKSLIEKKSSAKPQ